MFWIGEKLKSSWSSLHAKSDGGSAEELLAELSTVVERNIQERNRARALEIEKTKMEQHILSTLKSEISGPVICALNDLQPQLLKLKCVESRLDEALETWVVIKSLMVEYRALWQVIAEEKLTWDTMVTIETSPALLKEMIDIETKLEDQVLLRSRMVNLRIDQMNKVLPHLGTPWPKIAETGAVHDLTELIKFQIRCLRHSTKFFEMENCKRDRLVQAAAKRLRTFEKLDKFGEQVPCSCMSRKKRPLTTSNLHIWQYSPLKFVQATKLDVAQDGGPEEDNAANLQVWKFLGGADSKLVGQIVKLVQHLDEVEKRQVEVQIRLDELELVDQKLKKAVGERNVLQHELNRNRKFLTQIMLEKMVHQNTRLKNLLVSTSYPQSADPVVQELVQKNIELGNHVQELEEVVRYSREDAVKHQERSRVIINSLNNAINSLEEVAVEFVLHEQTDQNLMFKLKAIVEKDRMHSLMSKLNEDDLQILQESLRRGNVGEVLIQLTEDLSNQRERFRKLLNQMGQDDLNSAVIGLSDTQLSALSEAVTTDRLETASELILGSKPSADIQLSAEHEERAAEVLKQVQQLVTKLEVQE